jgi:hypothetical protein
LMQQRTRRWLIISVASTLRVGVKAEFFVARCGPAAAPKKIEAMRRLAFFCGDNMAKRTTRTITKSSRKVSKTSFKAIKKQAKERTVAEKAATKRVAPSSDAPTASLTGREARRDERFRELAAWYMLQGADETTARRRAQDEIDDDPRKD